MLLPMLEDMWILTGNIPLESLSKKPSKSIRPLAIFFVIDATSLVAHYRKGELLNEEFPEKVLKARIAAVSFYTGRNKAHYVITKLDGQ